MAIEEKKAVSLSAWKKNATHYPTLPSGSVVGIKIPDLPALLAGGDIPQTLLEVALGATTGQNPTPSRELLGQQKEFTDRLVQVTVVDPPLKDADIDSIPYEDKLFLVEFATRQRDLDALGEHLAGLPTAKKWETFRSGDDGDTALEDL
jgi:hypothetical protein